MAVGVSESLIELTEPPWELPGTALGSRDGETLSEPDEPLGIPLEFETAPPSATLLPEILFWGSCVNELLMLLVRAIGILAIFCVNATAPNAFRHHTTRCLTGGAK